jgi:hypothetical protein
MTRGLTRPHHPRRQQGRIFVDNSGYGQLVSLSGTGFDEVARFGSWTRGLCLQGNIAFVGLSRVIPRFSVYAPGLTVDKSRCGVAAIELATGRTLATLWFPLGNQIFAVEAVPSAYTTGLPFDAARTGDGAARSSLFYLYTTRASKE